MAALNITLAQALAILTGPLATVYPASTVIKLTHELEASLFDHYVSSWNPLDPLRGSGRRCLTLGAGLPPRPVYTACKAANVNWSVWFAALGGAEFDLLVDPGSVAVRPVATREAVVLWTAAPAAREAEAKRAKTLAQQLLEDDRTDADELFALLDDELRAPEWLTPMLDSFPGVPARPARSGSPASTHSRTSSFSSASSSSGASFSSVDTAESGSPAGSPSSRRERARQPRVFIDRERREVTPYDGGKTTVLTGGVMLGGKPAAPKPTGRPSRF